MTHNDDAIWCQITDYFSEEIDDSQNAVSTLLENFELPDIGNVKDTKFALKMGKYFISARWRERAQTYF